MTKIVDNDTLTNDETFEEVEDVDNDESFDLDGDLDDDVNTDATEEETEEESEETEEVEEDEELDDTLETDDSENEEESGDIEENGETENSTEETEQTTTEPPQEDEKEIAITNLKDSNQKLVNDNAKLKSLVKDTLAKLGVEINGDTDIEEVMEKTIAEYEGVSLEEFRKRKQVEEILANQQAQAKKQGFEQLAATDLADLKKSFPNLLKVDKIRDCFDSVDDFIQFGKLRDSGVAVKNAYLAVNGEKIRNIQSQKATVDNKSHITSVTQKKATDNSIVMPKAILREWREIFPDKSDKEIQALYKKSM